MFALGARGNFESVPQQIVATRFGGVGRFIHMIERADRRGKFGNENKFVPERILRVFSEHFFCRRVEISFGFGRHFVVERFNDCLCFFHGNARKR